MGTSVAEKNRLVRQQKKQKYEKVKAEVKRLEEKNFSHLILFRSGEEWMKMAGNSLLIYYYLIAPTINVKPNLQPDTDYTETIFPGGVLSFRGTAALEKKLKKADVLKGKKEAGELVVYELNFRASTEEIEKCRGEMKYDQERALSVLRPATVLAPDIYDSLRHIQKRVFEVVRKMSVFERDYNGNLIAEYSRKMIKYYMMINNGAIEEPEGWKKILETDTLLIMEIVFATELKEWRQDVAISIGSELIEVKRAVERRLNGKGVVKKAAQVTNETRANAMVAGGKKK